MMIAKMQVLSVTKHAYGGEQVKLGAVCDGSPENNSFSKATPSATLDITIDNPAAQGILVPGKCFYLDFTSAPTT